MATDIDALLDRRQMRRRLTFWRAGAFLLLIVALLAVLASAGVFDVARSGGEQVARVRIAGAITKDREMISMLDELAKNDDVKAVLLSINSPGGSAVGGEAMFEAVRRLAEKKPVAASVDELAASAGYMIAIASDHVVARRASIVGSIGVILQFPNFKTLLDKIGVEVNEAKSSPLKAEPSPFGTPPPETDAMLQAFIDDAYEWFVDLVAERRPFDRATALRLADGSVYSGGQGLENKLIDELGGEREAKAWLVKKADLKEGIPLRTWKPKRESTGGLLSAHPLAIWVAKQLGIDVKTVDVNDLPAFVPKRLFLDGLLAIWHD